MASYQPKGIKPYVCDNPQQPCRFCGRRMDDHGWVELHKGGHVACPGFRYESTFGDVVIEWPLKGER